MTTITSTSPDQLSDRELLDATKRVAGAEQRTTVELIALLAEVETRRLYLGLGFSSLYPYCRQVLHLSEHEAYLRMESARAVCRFPMILDGLRDGSLTLTSVAMLKPHLTPENHTEVLKAACHKSKRDVEVQMAALAPRADSRPVVRRLPSADRNEPADRPARLLDVSDDVVTPPPARPVATPVTVVKPIAPERYVIKVTVSAEAHARLRRAQDLLQHRSPGADPAVVIEQALSLLVERLEREKAARVSRPRPRAEAALTSVDARKSDSRHIPAEVRRSVWTRDGGRCAFEGTRGRCTETGRLEFHHRSNSVRTELICRRPRGRGDDADRRGRRS
jgi:hypothetical protein